jgi:hypothetical protein
MKVVIPERHGGGPGNPALPVVTDRIQAVFSYSL